MPPTPPLVRQALLAMMAQEGVPRQAAAYLQVAEALASRGRHADAADIIELMRTARLQPSPAATLACLRAVQGVQPAGPEAESAAGSDPNKRRLLQLLHEEWTAPTLSSQPPRSPSSVAAGLPSPLPPPSTPPKKAPPSPY